MRVRILGPLEVEDESGRALELGPPKQRALLALLVISPNSLLSTERIVDELWGDQPPTDGPRNVRVYVSRLRKVLEPGRAKRAPGRLIVTEQAGYALRIDPERIDAHQFERLIGEARSEIADDPESARSTIVEALGLWRDHPLAGLELEDFAQGEIRRLEELHLTALELRLEASLRVDEPRSVVPELEKLVVEHPLRERFVALLMEALADSGRQAEALRTYRSLKLHMANEMGLQPSSELRYLEERILLQQEERVGKPPSSDPEPQPGNNLPARLTSLVGREHDLDEVAKLLDGTRLLTLTGPGGVGKTSLGVETARGVEARYSGGVCFVDLSPVRDSTGFIDTIADALDVKVESGAQLLSAIVTVLGRDRPLLLLDNSEHMVDPVSSFVEEVLHAAPDLTIICTSRRSLTVDGEAVYEVAPLDLPAIDADINDLRHIASSRLLSDRAAAASPGFEITSENASDVAALCRRLDGIPLGIELAASNLRSMTTREIAESLGDRLSLGGRRRGIPRHQTLRATMQWSYDLLQDEEQELFDRLSMFTGRFSREAALAMGAARDAVPLATELAALVDASMIVANVSGRASWYRILPTLRDFGLFNLRERGDIELVRRAHAEYLASDAAEMDIPSGLKGSPRRIERNVSIEDFRTAVEWALQGGQSELAVELLVPLGFYWANGGRLDEAAHWLGRVNEIGAEGSLSMWTLQLTAAIVDWMGGHNEQAELAFRSLSAEALEMGEPDAAADALQHAAYVRWRRGDLSGARDDMTTAAEAGSERVARSMPAREGLAVIELYLGNITAAEQQARVLGAFADRTGDPIARSRALNVQAWVECYRGNLDESIRFFEQCRDIAMEVGDWHHEVNARIALAWVFPSRDLPDQALTEAVAAHDLSVSAGNLGKQAEASIAMGCAQLDLGDLPQAAQSLLAGLELLRDHVQRVDHMTRGLRFAGWIAQAGGRPRLALRFLTAVATEHRRIRYVDPPPDAARSARELTAARGMLDDTLRDTLIGDAERAPFPTILDEAIAYLHEVAETLS